jgi:hypothetical protein
MIVINDKCLQEQIKYRLNSWNACYHSDLNLVSSCLPSKGTQELKYVRLNFMFCMCVKLLKQGALNSCIKDRVGVTRE